MINKTMCSLVLLSNLLKGMDHKAYLMVGNTIHNERLVPHPSFFASSSIKKEARFFTITGTSLSSKRLFLDLFIRTRVNLQETSKNLLEGMSERKLPQE